MGELEVRLEGVGETLLPENASLGDVPHQKLSDDEVFRDDLFEANRALLRCFPQRLPEHLQSIPILQLHDVDPTDVVTIPCDLVWV